MTAEKFKTNILCSVTFSESHDFYEIMCKRNPCTTREATDDFKIWGMRVASWISKATDICAEYAILITFPQKE
jgi:hypothetical protein